MAEQTFDVLVLGGGTGGYVAAIRGAQLGLRVALVEKDQLGGTCLHRGCIPSKAFLRSAEVYHTLQNAAEFGLTAGEVGVDFGRVLARKERIVGQLHKGVQQLMKKNGITVLQGTGTLMPPSIFAPGGSVSVDTPDGGRELISPEQIIIATGSRPRSLPGLPFDGVRVVSSDHVLAEGELPRSVIIVGAGAIGVEWASLYSDFGVEVTLVESLDRILPLEDEGVSAEMARVFKKRKIQLLTGARLLPDTYRVEDGQAAIQVAVGNEQRTLRADKLLVSIGREPVSAGLGLENFDKVHLKNGYIVVDDRQRTGDPHIYAIGDVVGGGLAHVAAHQGVIAMETIAGGQPRPLDPLEVPRCTYSRPEVASLGLTEGAARENGHEIKVGKFPFRALGKAMIYGEADGFVKLISDAKTDDLLGVHLIGPHVTDLIAEGALAKLLDATAWEIGRAIHPHPTLAEAFGEAALAVDGAAINF